MGLEMSVENDTGKEGETPDARAIREFSRGKRLEAAGRFAGAAARYRRALELKPNHAGALVRLAHLRERANATRDARRLY